MIEVVVVDRNNKGEPLGTKRSQTFHKGASAAIWYDRQRGHNIARELEAAEKEIPVVRHKGG